MNVAIFAYVEPLSLECFIFGPDCVLDFNGRYFFTATWPHFAVSEADQLIKVGDVALLESQCCLPDAMGGNVADKSYTSILSELAQRLWIS